MTNYVEKILPIMNTYLHLYVAKPLTLLFLTPRPVLFSHWNRTLVCLLWNPTLCSLTSDSHYCSQVCFELLDVSHSLNYSFSNT